MDPRSLAGAFANTGLRPYLKDEAAAYYSRARNMERYLDRFRVEAKRPGSLLAHLQARYRAVQGYVLCAEILMTSDEILDVGEYRAMLGGEDIWFNKNGYGVVAGLVEQARAAWRQDQAELGI